MDQIVKEAVEIQPHAESVNKEAGFMFSHTWQLVASLLKCCPYMAAGSQFTEMLSTTRNTKHVQKRTELLL